MEMDELKEGTEHAREKGEKKIGLTMAITAVLLAVATLLSHRAHTEEGLLQGKIVDEWNFYQAKHARAHEYGADAELAALFSHPDKAEDIALKDYKKSLDEECGTPPEPGCSSPAKDSVILQPLLADKKNESGREAKGEHTPPSKAAEEAKESSKESSPTANAAEQHEKPGNARPGAVKIQETAREMEHERDMIERRANYYDGSELFLEISIVLCSIALLADNRLFWQLSFITTAIGLAIMVWGLLGLQYSIGLH